MLLIILVILICAGMSGMSLLPILVTIAFVMSITMYLTTKKNYSLYLALAVTLAGGNYYLYSIIESLHIHVDWSENFKWLFSRDTVAMTAAIAIGYVIVFGINAIDSDDTDESSKSVRK